VSPRHQLRVAFEPLERLALAVTEPYVETDNGMQSAGTTMRVARALGTHDNNVRRWRREGLPEHRADSFAVALGRHPAELWDVFRGIEP